MTGAPLTLLLLLVLAACQTAGTVATHAAVRPERASAPGKTGVRAALHYEVSWADDLDTVAVVVCFVGRAPEAFVAGAGEARSWLLAPRLERTDGTARALERTDGRIDLAQASAGDCLHYRVDLRAAGRRFEGALMVRSGVWLWRPPRRQWSTFARIRMRVHAPTGADFSAAWPRDRGGDYHPDTTVFGLISRVVVGRYRLQAFDAAGARFVVALMPGAAPHIAALAQPWLTQAADTAAAIGGRFPAPRALIILVPGNPLGEGLGFGFVARGGGPSITFHVGGRATLAALTRGWTTVHEFSHLWLPFVARDDAWLSEGMATYYQEVLRVRAGVHPAWAAWTRLWEGARLGVRAQRSLAEDSRRMYRELSFRKVYWGGAAYALLADLELRRRTRGQQSLDTALAALNARRAPVPRGLSARELLAQLDRTTGTDVFTTLSTRVVETPPYPSLDRAFVALGLRHEDGAIHRAPAELAWVRDAILSPP